MRAEGLSERGYVLFERLVPPSLCRAVIDAIAEHLGIDADDPSTFVEAPEPVNGIVPIHQHRALWAVREHPPIHEVFAELIGERALWVTMDRAGFKPPAPSASSGPNFLHLDKAPTDPSGPSLQGLVYLSDTAVDQAAFECVPSLYRELITRPRSMPDPIDLDGHELVRVPGAAGSLLVWSTALPHGSSHNPSARPRFTQYLSMFPAGSEEERAERVELYRASRAPSFWRDIPGQRDPEPWPPAPLSPLGRRLLGLDRW
jgi:hypothetical protein